MNLFDFITVPKQARPVDEYERRRREQLMLPPPTVTGSMSPGYEPTYVGGSSSVPQYDNSDLPQVAPAPMEPTRARLVNQRQKTRQLQDFENNPVKNNDRGWAGRLLDVVRQGLISAGQAYDKSSGSPTERLMSAVGGGVAGGVYGGFHPQVDEERQRLYDIGRSQQLEGEYEGQIQRDQNRMLVDARIADIPEDRRIKELQIESTERSKALAAMSKDKYYDPTNTLHVQRAIRAGLDPAQMVAFDDRDPKTIKLGNDFLEFDRATGKWKIAGTRGDLIDWKLPDGRVVSIPADKAAYNATLAQMNAERIESTNRNADARIVWDKEKVGKAHSLATRQMDLAEQKYRDAKTAEERRAAMDLMNDALKTIGDIVKDPDLNEEDKVSLIELQNYRTRVYSSMRPE